MKYQKCMNVFNIYWWFDVIFIGTFFFSLILFCIFLVIQFCFLFIRNFEIVSLFISFFLLLVSNTHNSSTKQFQMVGGNNNSRQYNDTTSTKIFVGGLAWQTQGDAMRKYFEQFGEILEAVVITDKNTGKSKGYGFVSYLPFLWISYLYIDIFACPFHLACVLKQLIFGCVVIQGHIQGSRGSNESMSELFSNNWWKEGKL